jgi:hypothetical protein
VSQVKRFGAFSIRENRGGSIWVRAGTGYANKDGSMNLVLDVLPLNGRLHIREVGEKRDSANGSTAHETAGEVAPEASAAGVQP